MIYRLGRHEGSISESGSSRTLKRLRDSLRDGGPAPTRPPRGRRGGGLASDEPTLPWDPEPDLVLHVVGLQRMMEPVVRGFFVSFESWG
jgi:hypothetical protein